MPGAVEEFERIDMAKRKPSAVEAFEAQDTGLKGLPDIAVPDTSVAMPEQPGRLSERFPFLQPTPNPEEQILTQLLNLSKGAGQLVTELPQFFVKDLPEALAATVTRSGKPGIGTMAKEMTKDTAKTIAATMMRQLNPEEYERWKQTPEGQEVTRMIYEEPLRPLMAPLIFSGAARGIAKKVGVKARGKMPLMPEKVEAAPVRDIMPKLRYEPKAEAIPMMELPGIKKPKVVAKETITETAFKVKGEVVPSGGIHNAAKIPERLANDGSPGWKMEEGFLTSKGRYVNRKEAAAIGGTEYKTLTHAEIPKAPPIGLKEKPVAKPKVEPVGAKRAAKEPWEMTQKEWVDELGKRPQAGYAEQDIRAAKARERSKQSVKKTEELYYGIKDWEIIEGTQLKRTRPEHHKAIISKAISERKPVPAEVLADYPELKAKTPKVEEPSVFKNPLGRDAFAYLENVDRIKALAKKQKGAEYVSDINWLSSTDTILRRAFGKEKRPGELFGDYLQRISGRSVKPKSLPFQADYPDLAKPKPQVPAKRQAPPTRAKAEVAETAIRDRLKEIEVEQAKLKKRQEQYLEKYGRIKQSSVTSQKRQALSGEEARLRQKLPSERGAALNIPKEIARPAGAEPVPYKEAIKTPDRPEMASMESYYKTIMAPEAFRPPAVEFAKQPGVARQIGIAERQTKGGKIVPAVRKAGTFVPEDFAVYKNFKDAKQGVFGGTKDFIRYMQEVDGALSLQKKAKLPGQAGPVEKYVLRRTEDMVKIELDWSAEQTLRIEKIVKGLSKKQEQLVTQVLEETSRPGSYVETADFATNARIRKLTSDTKVVKAAQESRKALEHWFSQQNRLRTLRNQPLINYREYYAPHILREATLWERAFGSQVKPKEIMSGPQLPDYIKPNKPFNPRELAREIGIPNFMREMRIGKLLEDYANTASRDIHHTSIIQNNKAFIQQLETMGYKNAADGISNFTAEGFGGVKSWLDRGANLPTWVAKGMRWWRGSLMRSVFPLNFTWNTFVQTLSSGLTVMREGITNSTRGMVDWFANPAMRNKIKSSYSYRVKSRRGGRITRQDINTGVTEMVQGKRSAWQAGIDGANYLTELIERELTGWSIASGLRRGAKRGMRGKPLWNYASDSGAKSQSMYNLENKPGMLRSEIVQTGAPFQTFVFEMYNTAKEFAGKTGTPPGAMTERIGWVLRFTAAAYAGNEISHAITGRRPWEIYSFIPFSDQWIKPVIDALRGKPYDAISGRGLPSFVGAGIQFAGAVRSYLRTGDTRKIRNWGLKYGTAFMKIPGGTQVARMVDGWIAVANGGMKDASGRTQFKIKDPWEKVRAVAMGPYRTKAGIEYWEKRETNILEDILGKPKKKKRLSIVPDLNAMRR